MRHPYPRRIRPTRINTSDKDSFLGGRSKGIPSVWQDKHNKAAANVDAPISEAYESSVSNKEQNSTWAKLIKKVYGVDPLICPKCGSPMEIIAIIMEPEETTRILKHLVNIGRSPPNFDPSSFHP